MGCRDKICDILTPASYESLPCWPHRFPHFGYIHLGGGGLWYMINVGHSTYLQVSMPTSAPPRWCGGCLCRSWCWVRGSCPAAASSSPPPPSSPPWSSSTCTTTAPPPAPGTPLYRLFVDNFAQDWQIKPSLLLLADQILEKLLLANIKRVLYGFQNKFFFAQLEIFLFLLVLGLRGTIITSPIMVQSKMFFLQNIDI